MKNFNKEKAFHDLVEPKIKELVQLCGHLGIPLSGALLYRKGVNRQDTHVFEACGGRHTGTGKTLKITQG